MSFELLFLVVLAGLVGPLLSGSRRLALPLVVGEIIAGIVIGNSGFGFINPADPMFTFLSLVGFATLLFVVGVKLPLRDEGLRSVLSTGVKASLLTFALSGPFALGLTYLTHIDHPGLFVLLCACSSTSTVVPMLLERNLTGRVIVLTTCWIAICDMATMIALPLVMATGKVESVAVGTIVVTLSAVGCFVGMKFFRATKTGEHLRQLSKENHWALDMRLSLAMLFGLAWLATKFGTSVLVAGFAAGVVASAVGHPRRFYKQLIGLGEGFLIPLFFVHLGASIDVRGLFGSVTNLELAAAITVAGLCVHMVAAKLSGLPQASGFAASAQMGFPAAVVSMGLSDGFISPGQGAAIIAAALLTLLSCSYGVKLFAATPGVVVSGNRKKASDEEPADEE